jgi:hypothetical protein
MGSLPSPEAMPLCLELAGREAGAFTLVDVAYNMLQDSNRWPTRTGSSRGIDPEQIGLDSDNDGRVSRVRTGRDGQLRLLLRRRHSGEGGSRATGSQGRAAARRYFVPSSAK